MPMVPSKAAAEFSEPVLWQGVVFGLVWQKERFVFLRKWRFVALLGLVGLVSVKKLVGLMSD
jgi:hypothetical protein